MKSISARLYWGKEYSRSLDFNGHIYEVKSTFILQPGPAALTEGIRQLHAIIARTMNQPVDPILLPEVRTDEALQLSMP
jgi:hypothetical protein